MSHILYIDNTGYIQLQGYKNGLTGEYINDAIVSLEVKDKEGQSVSGLLPSIPLSYESGSNGNYSATLSEDAEVVNNQIIKAKVTATSSGIKSTFNCDVVCKKRSCK